jgi:hypothetical protein
MDSAAAYRQFFAVSTRYLSLYHLCVFIATVKHQAVREINQQWLRQDELSAKSWWLTVDPLRAVSAKQLGKPWLAFRVYNSLTAPLGPVWFIDRLSPHATALLLIPLALSLLVYP